MTRSAGGRRRSATVSVSLAAIVAAGLAGCSSGPDYEGVCADDVTQQRVEDERCDDDSSHHHWMYYGRGSRVPAIGQDTSLGSRSTPNGASVSRGGFGRDGGTVGG